jgi:hypothetical protein
VSLVGCEVHGAAEHVQHATIDVRASESAEPIVEILRIATSEIGDACDAEILQATRDARPDSRNTLELRAGLRHWSTTVSGPETRFT